jgi:hypothetical protein
MPATARWRGLADPFDPLEAIAQTAKLLRDLRREFGNLGLAAAAYNAGPGRVRDWLAGRRGLPRETSLGLILESCSAANSVHAGRPFSQQQSFVARSIEYATVVGQQWQNRNTPGRGIP